MGVTFFIVYQHVISNSLQIQATCYKLGTLE